MDDFGFAQRIPLEEAAAFYIRAKHGGDLAQQKIAADAEAIGQAAAQAAGQDTQRADQVRADMHGLQQRAFDRVMAARGEDAPNRWGLIAPGAAVGGGVGAGLGSLISPRNKVIASAAGGAIGGLIGGAGGATTGHARRAGYDNESKAWASGAAQAMPSAVEAVSLGGAPRRTMTVLPNGRQIEHAATLREGDRTYVVEPDQQKTSAERYDFGAMNDEGLNPLQRAQLNVARYVAQHRAPETPDTLEHAGVGAAGGALGGAGLGALTSVLTRGRIKAKPAAAVGGAVGSLLGGGTGGVVGHDRREDYLDETQTLALNTAQALPYAMQAARRAQQPVALRIGQGDDAFDAAVIRPRGLGGGQEKSASLKKRAALLDFDVLCALYKAANESAVSDSMAAPSPLAAPSPEDWFANEQQAMAAEQQNMGEHYKAKADMAEQRAQEAEQQAAEIQAQAEEMQAAQAEHEEQLTAAQQGEQMAQRAALAQVQNANSNTTQAVQAALAAESQLNNMRQSLLGLVAGGSPAQPMAPDAGLNQAGMPAQDGGMGPGTPGAGVGAAAPPNGVPVGGAPQSPAMGQAPSPMQDPSAAAQGVKQSSAMDARAIREALGGAGIGAVLGGAGAAAESQGLLNTPESLQAAVDKAEARRAQGGVSGFRAGFALAKARAMQTLNETTREHPALATAAGALMGAGAGATAGPEVMGALRQLRAQLDNAGAPRLGS